MSFKKKASKSIALALTGVIIATPLFNTVSAMEKNSYTDNKEKGIHKNISIEYKNESNIIELSEKDKLEIQEFLKKKEEGNDRIKAYPFYAHSFYAVPIQAVYFIPGVGEVALLATGGIAVAGATYYAGSWLYKKVYPHIIGFRIPSRLKKDGNTVDLGKFTDKVRGKTAYRNPKTGWTIEKDNDGHKGSKWKLKDKKGERKASLRANGDIAGE